MEGLDSHTHQELAKVQLGARHEPENLPASLSFKDLQSICGKTSMEIKAIPVKGYPRANILGCYGFLSLCRHKSSDEDGWEHLPHDLLVAVVKHLEPEDARSMHRVCQSWHLAVRCGLQGMKPSPKLTSFPDIRDYFPRVNSLHLLNFTLKAKHLVQLATVTRLEHLSLDNVTLEARNTIQRLTSLQGSVAFESSTWWQKHLDPKATFPRRGAIRHHGTLLLACGLDTMFMAIQGLRSLEMINVVGAYPTETEEFLNSLHSLTKLVVCNNTAAVKMAPMHCLASMPLLQVLTLSETLHSILPGLSKLTALTDLHSLRLTKVGVTNGVLRGLSGLTKLHTLHMPDAYRVTNAGLHFISTLTGLTHLDFSSRSNRRDENTTDEGAEAISGMTALHSLSLSGHKDVTADGLAWLVDCTAMTSLDLSGAKSRSPVRRDKLQTLSLSGHKEVTADGRARLVDYTCMTSIDLPDVGLGVGGCNFLWSMQQLQTLSLARTRLEPSSLGAVLGSLTTLTTLSLAWCSVTDEACCELAKLVKVTHLDLRYCPLTNAGMAVISHGMPRLEYCNVEGCKLTCLGMLALLRHHKCLRVWGPEQNNMHRFMNVADALLICQFAPGQRRLRVSYFPEASMGLTALVSCGVASFFLLYFGILLLFFTALFMFPILMLGCICVALCLAVLGARYTVRNLRRVWLRCDFAFSTFLLGQHAPAVDAHQDGHLQQHGFEEV